jgi:twitching motility protein PilT
VCACEVLISTPACKNLIREGKTHQLYTVMQTGGQHGMQTMNSSLADLVKRRHITRELAIKRSSVPDELERLLLSGAA